jgi:hypothetical protein
MIKVPQQVELTTQLGQQKLTLRCGATLGFMLFWLAGFRALSGTSPAIQYSNF